MCMPIYCFLKIFQLYYLDSVPPARWCFLPLVYTCLNGVALAQHSEATLTPRVIHLFECVCALQLPSTFPITAPGQVLERDMHVFHDLGRYICHVSIQQCGCPHVCRHTVGPCFLVTYWVPGAIGHSILRPEDPVLTSHSHHWVCSEQAGPRRFFSCWCSQMNFLVPGLGKITWWMVCWQKMRGHAGKKSHGDREIAVEWAVGVWVHRDSWLGAQMGSVLEPNTNDQRMLLLSNVLHSAWSPLVPNCWSFPHSSQ